LKTNNAACFIPIKARSTRVPGKNLRELNGKRLFEYIVDSVVESKVFSSVYVDTDCGEVVDYAKLKGCKIINRDPELATDSANGNDLLNYWYENYPNYDFYFQLFATSPFTKKQTIIDCVDILSKTIEYDSVFTAYEECGWYWFSKKPINYDPKVLPRSQDAKKVFSETTALYGITNNALQDMKCRIGKNPYFYFVDEIESVDIDSNFDFQFATILAKTL